KSSARRLGDKARIAVLGFYVLCFALALAAAWKASLGPLFLPLAGLFALHLSRQAVRVDPADPIGALKLFKSNRDAGLILFAGFVLDALARRLA
ncbi:MAG: 4-hydroxybenzoate octaprenyltransferase, partial [Xanthobacteraceae bacterium]